jgi:glutaredoxin 3
MSDDLRFLSGHRLTVYSSNGCPDCTRLDRWLRQSGIEHGEVKIDEEPDAADKLERETGKQAVPFVLVDGKRWVRGYHRELPGRFDPRLFLAELRSTVEPPGDGAS